MLDFTLTHTLRSQVHSIGQLTHTRRSDGAPDPDGALRAVARTKILHYRQLYIDRPEPIVFMSVTVDTSTVFTMTLVSYCFSTLTVNHRLCLTSYQRNRVNSVGLILAKTSTMRISIPLDLSSRPFIPLPRFIRSRRSTPLLAPSLVFPPRRSA